MMPNDISVVQKLALATYKSKLPTEKEALEEARKLLDGLNPSESTDTETLGLLQAVHKTLWSLTGDRSHLDKAIWSSEKGFYLKNDYYNGINLAYLYNVRASLSAGSDAVTDFVLAQRTRRRVVEICQTMLDQIKKAKGTAKKTSDRDTKYWLLATLAEAWTGLGDEAKSQGYQKQALALNPPQWMIKNPREQLKKLRELLADSPLKSELLRQRPPGRNKRSCRESRQVTQAIQARTDQRGVSHRAARESRRWFGGFHPHLGARFAG